MEHLQLLAPGDLPLLAASGAPKLAALEKEIDADGKPHSRVIDGATVSAKFAIVRTSIKTKNVVAVLEGRPC